MNRGPVFRQIYDIVAHIPAGRVMTYGQIASLLEGGYSPKLVGFAMSSAPDELPCHRVINRKGEMAPGMIFGGPDAQRRRLMAEGVPFAENGCVDLSKALLQIN